MLQRKPAETASADGHSVASHIRETLGLALPIIVSRAGLLVLFTVDTLVTGRVGGLELAGLGLGTAPLLAVMMISLGAMQAAVVLAAQAIGSGHPREVGAIFRAGCVNAFLLGVLSALPVIFAEPFFVATGQAPEVAAIAAGVAVAFGWGLPGHLLFLTASLVLEATGRPRTGMAIMLGANIVNLLLDGVFVLGWGDLVETGGAATAMATSSVVRWGTFVAAFAIVMRDARRDGDPYGFLAPTRTWLAEAATVGGRHGREMRRMGLPMGLGQGVESAAFSTVVFLAGLLGPATIAAHQTTMTVMSLVYMNAVGLGGAASIRVGQAAGRRHPVDLARAGWSAIGLGGLMSGTCGLLMILFPGEIARLVVDDPAAVAIAERTLHFGGYFVAFDAMMGVAMGALRGVGDVWVPMWMQAAAFWFVGIPVSALAGLKLGYEAMGLFAGIAAGIAASLVLLLPRFGRIARRSATHRRPKSGDPAGEMA